MLSENYIRYQLHIPEISITCKKMEYLEALITCIEHICQGILKVIFQNRLQCSQSYLSHIVIFLLPSTENSI